ncbi:DUF4190 domain-containing protein [Microbacterium sp. zg.Y909]|uniref:DUF4190 domain-containing protein n=1 Tax=Microbacterium sp. zg.Y909 TaxID=2969413 RepID=UPI00214B46A1|nr:DUF4190 domain-containing protein [Microbacterium sp. zg.Y909]MCR2826553.1 DUF4190 domain-containing protein [Microbacterium sp. zg.Y909]
MSTPDNTPPAGETNEPAAPTPPPYTAPAYTPPPAYSPPPAGAPYAAPPAQPPYAAPAAPAPYGQAGTEQTSYSAPAYPPAPPAPYGQAPYGQAPYAGAYGYAQPKTNLLAILSLVSSILGIIGILPIVGSIAGAILGHLALRQIPKSGEKGRGMALAGTIVGWVGIGLVVLLIVLFAVIWIVGVGSLSSTY